MRICKDCAAEIEAFDAWQLRQCCDWQSDECPRCKGTRPPNPPATNRPIVEKSGGRCATHWRAERKRRKAAAHERRVQKVYGLSDGDYDRLYEAQGGVCAICRRATGASRRLSVDHDHRTGVVRMLACRPCNDMLGHGRDDPEFFRRAAEMLESTPAQRLGIVALHEDFGGSGGDVA